MKFAKIGASIAIAAAAVASLSACESRVGAAAVVGDHRISEVSVTNYLTPLATPIVASDGSGTTIPRVLVLQSLVQEELLTRVLDANGGPPTNAELAAGKADVLQQLGGTDDQITGVFTGAGLSANFEPLYVQTNTLTEVFVTRNKITSQDIFNSKLASDIKAEGISVSVNSRYGTWDPATSSIGATTVPSFLTVTPTTPAATAAPSAG